MLRIRCVSDAEECRQLWQANIPQVFISDLWEVRDCFNRFFGHRPHFVVAEEGRRVRGFLPLSWNEETGSFSYFPGETWEGKTWLEQNRIIADSRRTLERMLETLSQPYYLRYLRSDSVASGLLSQVDEIGYMFMPGNYNYDLNSYFEEFSHKTAKRLRRELAAWDSRGVRWDYDNPDDFDIMIRMNLERYGEMSYFNDQRFLDSFRSLAGLLRERGWLRMVKVTVEGEPAAVDLGSVYNGTLTLLAGGTNAAFPGIAKLINVHHMSWACQQRLERVDFLCGDFNWKTMFHLTPSPLCLLQGDGLAAVVEPARSKRDLVAAVPAMDVQGVSNA